MPQPIHPAFEQRPYEHLEDALHACDAMDASHRLEIIQVLRDHRNVLEHFRQVSGQARRLNRVAAAILVDLKTKNTPTSVLAVSKRGLDEFERRLALESPVIKIDDVDGGAEVDLLWEPRPEPASATLASEA